MICRLQQFGFQLAPEAARLGLTGAFLVIDGFRNRAGDPAFDKLLADTTREVLASVTDEDPVLRGYRELHDAIGRSNKRFVAAPENLLRLVRRNGSLPRINLLVDIYNLVSLKTRLALGAHDLARITGNVELRLTRGTEPFHPLGVPQPTTVGEGEYAYIDGSGEVLCRLEVRQCEKTKVTLETTGAFFIIQGNRATLQPALRAAGDELVRLVTAFCGGQARWLHLSGESAPAKL